MCTLRDCTERKQIPKSGTAYKIFSTNDNQFNYAQRPYKVRKDGWVMWNDNEQIGFCCFSDKQTAKVALYYYINGFRDDGFHIHKIAYRRGIGSGVSRIMIQAPLRMMFVKSFKIID